MSEKHRLFFEIVWNSPTNAKQILLEQQKATVKVCSTFTVALYISHYNPVQNQQYSPS